MKILFVQDFLRSGGTERQSVFLANHFAAAGHEVIFLTFRRGGILRSSLGPTIQQVTLQGLNWRLDWFAPGLTQRAAALRPDVAICFGRMANVYAGPIQAVLRGLAPPRPVVATMRTGKALPFLYRRSLLEVRAVVANSRAARKNLIENYAIPPGKIHVINNALVFPGDPGLRNVELRRTFSATETTTVLLSVAMFRPEKNQRALIEMAAGLPAGFDWQLWLVGDGPARGGCERLVREKNLSSRVKFLGWRADPSAVYRASDIAVHASQTESLSNFLIEAQAAGLPAVAMAAQGITECFLPDDTGFLIADKDLSGFRQRVLFLSQQNERSRAERGARARAFAAMAFSPPRQAEAYLRLFRGLIASPL